MERLRLNLMPLGLGLVCLALVMVLMAGCRGTGNHARHATTGGGMPVAKMESPADDEALPPIACGPFGPASIRPVYFAYDSAALDATALSDVEVAANRFTEAPETFIQVAGHCDERGTQEYNLALGERRAQEVRNQLRRLGISGSRIVTISFGEENPAVLGSDETAWAKNRRCEFMVAQ